jgi:hypothetical protein
MLTVLFPYHQLSGSILYPEVCNDTGKEPSLELRMTG